MERAELPVVVIQHSPNVPAGLLGTFLDEKKIPWKYVRLYAGESLPSRSEYSAIVSLGGIMGAYDEEEFPWLVDEKKWLAANTRDNTPILGICLGCQLLADALGGKAYRTPSGHELGFPAIVLNDAAHSDPVLSAPGIDVSSKSLEYVLCHGDTWDLPPGGTLLASSDRCPQVFRMNAALGVQFHPEATADMFTNWLQSVRESYVKSGRTPPLTEEQEAQLNQRTASSETQLKQRAYALFSAWFNTIPSLKHYVQN